MRYLWDSPKQTWSTLLISLHVVSSWSLLFRELTGRSCPVFLIISRDNLTRIEEQIGFFRFNWTEISPFSSEHFCAGALWSSRRTDLLFDQSIRELLMTLEERSNACGSSLDILNWPQNTISKRAHVWGSQFRFNGNCYWPKRHARWKAVLFNDLNRHIRRLSSCDSQDWAEKGFHMTESNAWKDPSPTDSTSGFDSRHPRTDWREEEARSHMTSSDS
jgi:hypothetical protein